METATSITENHVAVLIQDLNAMPEPAKEEIPETIKTEEENTQESAECRYCQDQDFVSNLISPCKCTGSLKYIHKSCLDKWYHAKGYCIICEICNEAFPDYYPLPEIISSDHENDHVTNEISVEPEPWTIVGTNIQIQSPVVLVGRAFNSLISSMNQDFNWRRPTFGMILGMALLFLVGGLVIKDAINCVPPKEEPINRFLYFTLVTVTVLVYILSWIHKCQEYRDELRQREIEMERERSV